MPPIASTLSPPRPDPRTAAGRARWDLPPAPLDRAEALAAALDIPPLTALLLVRRGVRDPEAARRFLRPGFGDLREPDLLPGMAEAATRIAAAVRDRERIAVYGDYDVDGVCGTALFVGLLRAAGADAIPYLPDRRTEGYGFNDGAVRRLAADGVRLIVTVDHGSRAVEGIALAASLGVDVVVTDHHLPGDGPIPAAVAIVNPLAPGPDGVPYPFPWLCGTGVAFKLAWAVARRLSGGAGVTAPLRASLADALPLVALATVADVVPLVDENRTAVVYGLSVLRKSPSPGLRALLDVSRLADRDLDAEDVAFRLAPRLNAAGRLGDAGRALELLLTTDVGRAADLALEIDGENEARRALQRRIVDEARERVPLDRDGLPPAGIVLAGDGWHVGVVGIVAARIAGEFHRPTVVIGMDGDRGRGSARSVAGFHLERALAACGGHLISHGGHAAAAGLEIARESVEEFARAFDRYADLHLPEESRVRSLTLDAMVRLDDMTGTAVRSLQRLAPWGQGNPAPLLAAEGLSIAGRPRVMGRTGEHLSFHVSRDGVSRRAVWFGGGACAEALAAAGPGGVSLAFRPALDRFRGGSEVELHVVDAHAG